MKTIGRLSSCGLRLHYLVARQRGNVCLEQDRHLLGCRKHNLDVLRYERGDRLTTSPIRSEYSQPKSLDAMTAAIAAVAIKIHMAFPRPKRAPKGRPLSLS
jgi:hypothetical protein